MSPPTAQFARLQGIPDGQEMELATMIIECSSNEKTFIKCVARLCSCLLQD